MTKIEVGFRDPAGPLDSPWGRELAKHEDRIKATEGESIEARWLFGRVILRRRGDAKQLPKGYTKAICAEHGLSRAEVQFRVVFAETYPTKKEVATAVATYGSWTQIRSKALPKTSRTKKPAGRLAFTVKRWRAALAQHHAADLTAADLRELTQLRDRIDTMLTDRISRKANAG
jgi:hypothetical protein